ncbi:putative glycogenin [Penicillium oxalicum 114-2]|uniref:glycogenin glucosyltransferase n=1 Tax=Penicillium oxalicum (strain 114-2 / CGMCC 5302) TaxID=933388 RepID=S7ZGP7_PENO1|nr:putative glycogenin [Penicillium oxalicum 114-2]
MASEMSAVYCTLLLSDSYLPGAMVLAHSLRDNGTKARLVALYTPDRLQAATINELKTVYDELIPVSPLVNGTPANLWLMDRPDLISTFTKIEMWRLTQFERIVYIDCDVVAIRAPDELLSLDVSFAAAPDVGWPDCFNSGMMVLRPNWKDYYALKALADRGISFDGADQGLLNMHFRDWHRLSFTYNCTPSANYQYIPAYKHFQRAISLIHFIGAQKPWTLPRQMVPLESPYNQLLRHWWSVYDKHYRPSSGFLDGSRPPSGIILPAPGSHVPLGHRRSRSSQSLKKVHFEDTLREPVGEYVAASPNLSSSSSHEASPPGPVQSPPRPWQETPPAAQAFTDSRPSETASQQSVDNLHDAQDVQDAQDAPSTRPESPAPVAPVLSAVPQYVRGEEHVSTYISPTPHAQAPVFQSEKVPTSQPSHLGEPLQNQRHSQAPAPPPSMHHPQPVSPVRQIQEPRPSSPLREPEVRSFEAPKAEWDASREPPPRHSKPEAANLQHQTYSMSEDTTLFRPPPSYPEAPKNMYYQVPPTRPEPRQLKQIFPWENHAPTPTRVFAPEPSSPLSSPPNEPQTAQSPSPPPVRLPLRAPYEPSAETWDAYSRSNAWDEDPDIQRYIASIQQPRRVRTQVISGSSHSSTSGWTSHSQTSSAATTMTGPSYDQRPSVILTNFPSEVERPVLPVTPAPIERRGYLQDDDQEASSSAALPAAEGVPDQQDWNPLTSLEELRRRQSEVLEHPERLQERLASAPSARRSDPSDDSST